MRRHLTSARPSADPRKITHAMSVKSVRDYLAAIGCWDLKVLGGIGQRRGAPDIIACWQGRFLAVEVKVGRDRLSADQERERADILRAGGLWVCATEQGAADVHAALVEAGWPVPGVLL